MADGLKKDAKRRLFLVLARVSKDEGVEIDGRDPAFRELCDSPELVSMSEDEMAARARGLVKLATDLPS